MKKILGGILSAMLFAFLFGLSATAYTWFIWELAHETGGESTRTVRLYLAIVHSLTFGAVAGAMAGFIFGMLPAKVKDVPVAVAVGVGVTLLMSWFAPFGSADLGFLFVVFIAPMSAFCAWLMKYSGVFT